MLCAKFRWNRPSGSGEKDENVKSLRTDEQKDGRTDGRQEAIWYESDMKVVSSYVFLPTYYV